MLGREDESRQLCLDLVGDAHVVPASLLILFCRGMAGAVVLLLDLARLGAFRAKCLPSMQHRALLS